MDLALNGQVVAHATDRNAAAPPALVEAGLYVDTSPLHGDERFAIRFDDFSISLR